MLSDHCPVLSVCPVLFVMLVYCSQRVGWIKMKLGVEVGLGPGHIVLDGDPAGQTAGWIKMPVGMDVGLGSGDIVLDGVPPHPKKRAQPPIFCPCLLWQNGRPSQRLLSSCCYNMMGLIQ